jgi:hypothetical protein
MIQIAVIVIGFAFAITGIVLFAKGVGSNDNKRVDSNDDKGVGSNDDKGVGSNDDKGVGSNDIPVSSIKVPGTEIRVPSNGLFIFAFGCVIILTAAALPSDGGGGGNGISPTPTPTFTPAPTATRTLTPTPELTPTSTQTPAPIFTPSVSIEKPRKDEEVIAFQRANDTAGYFNVSGTVSGIDPKKHPQAWLSLIFHEAESGEGLWWVQSSKQVGDRNDWSAAGHADDRFFKERQLHTVEVRAIVTAMALPIGSHLKVFADEKFGNICLTGTDSPCPVPLSKLESIVMSNIVKFKLTKPE